MPRQETREPAKHEQAHEKRKAGVSRIKKYKKSPEESGRFNPL